MARTTDRAATARRTRTSARGARGTYVDGNTVRKLSDYPERSYGAPARQPRRTYPEGPGRVYPENPRRAYPENPRRAYPENPRKAYPDAPRRAYPEAPRKASPAAPQRAPQKTARPASAQPRTLSREAKQNREKAMSMNRGFVIFIGVMSVAVLFFCIHYLRLKSEYTSKMSEVATLESQLAELREENNAYYSEVTSSVDLEKIRKIAIGRLGMQSPTEDQIQTYSTEGGSYVRQYQDVPES